MPPDRAYPAIKLVVFQNTSHGNIFPDPLLFCSRQHREEHSMDQYLSRLKLSENVERHWSIPISEEIHMNQSLVHTDHTFSWGNPYGPMVIKVLQKFPPALALVHGWLFPAVMLDLRLSARSRSRHPFRHRRIWGADHLTQHAPW